VNKMKIFINFLVIFFAFNSAHSQTEPVAVVSRLSGKAEVKKGSDGEPKLLTKNESLFAGQRVRCDQSRGCKLLEVSYCKNMAAKKIKSNWNRIYYIPCNGNDGIITGENKSEKDIIIYPKNLETLRLENFSIKWHPLEYPVKLDLIVEIDLGEEIYSAKGIDGSKGIYESAQLLNKLKAAQKDGEFSFNVVLMEHGEEKTKLKEPQSVNFMLLLPEKEASLNEELKLFEDETDQIFKLSGRTLLFGSYKLYTESAQESERILILPEVLKMTKDDENLSKILNLAATANYKALNTERTKQLCQRIFDLNYPRPEFACSE